MQSSNPQTIDSVAELLAKRAAAVRMIPPTPMKKQATAAPESNWLVHLGLTLTKMAEGEAPAPAPAPAPAAAAAPLPGLAGYSPWKTGLIGGGIGAALGGLAGYATTDKEEEENSWRNAMTGALAGGAVGGGLGVAAPSVGRLLHGRKLDSDIARLEAGGTDAGIPGDLASFAGRTAFSSPGAGLATLGTLGYAGSNFLTLQNTDKILATAADNPGVKAWVMKKVAPVAVADGVKDLATLDLDMIKSKGYLDSALTKSREALKASDTWKGIYGRGGGAPSMRRSLTNAVTGYGAPYRDPASIPSRLRSGGIHAGLIGAPLLAQWLMGKLPSARSRELASAKSQRKDLSNRPIF